MLCPFCLKNVTFKRTKPEGKPVAIFTCPTCKERVPGQYTRDYRRYPPVVVSVVGFRGHGKTVQLASLFHLLKKGDLPRHWSSFFTQGLDEEDLDTIYGNVKMLKNGMLPDMTPKTFPRPTMIRVTGIPGQRNCTWLCFDTGGECFEKPRQLVQYAHFVQRARTVMLLVSLSDMEDAKEELGKLLNIYISGIGELGGRTRSQHLVVVFTKADQIVGQFNGKWKDLCAYILNGTTEDLGNLSKYMRRMRRVSLRLQKFTGETLKAYEFLNAARSRFRSVEFCMVSALGDKPCAQQLDVHISPKRLFDPMLWIMEKSRVWHEQVWQWLW